VMQASGFWSLSWHHGNHEKLAQPSRKSTHLYGSMDLRLEEKMYHCSQQNGKVILLMIQKSPTTT